MNIKRRHMTKGQQVMAVAMMYPEPEKGGKGKRSRIQEGLDEPRKTFQNRLSQARTVLAHSSDLAQAVLAGSKFLDAAYDEARKANRQLDGKGVKTRRAVDMRRAPSSSAADRGSFERQGPRPLRADRRRTGSGCPSAGHPSWRAPSRRG